MSGRSKTFLAVLIGIMMLSSLAIAPAFGHHKEGHEGGPEDQEGTEQTDDTSTEEGDTSPGEGDTSEESDDDKPGNGPKDKEDNDKPHPNDDGQPGNGHEKGKGKGNQGNGNPGNGNGKGKGKGPKGDEPYTDGAPGNNGTIKIDGEPYDTSKGQEAHVGCNFRVLYWGTDEGEDLQSTLTFVAHPPTGGPFTFVDTVTLQAGEPDVAGPYNLVAGLQAAGIEPHPKQGWHIKLTTNTEYSQGADTKHKVFWFQCTETAPVVEGETEVVPCEDKMAEGEAVCGEDETVTSSAPDSDETAVLGSELEREAPGAPAAPEEDDESVAVAGESLERSPGILPFTGGDIGIFLLAGLALVGLGALFIRVRRTN